MTEEGGAKPRPSSSHRRWASCPPGLRRPSGPSRWRLPDSPCPWSRRTCRRVPSWCSAWCRGPDTHGATGPHSAPPPGCCPRGLSYCSCTPRSAWRAAGARRSAHEREYTHTHTHSKDLTASVINTHFVNVYNQIKITYLCTWYQWAVCKSLHKTGLNLVKHVYLVKQKIQWLYRGCQWDLNNGYNNRLLYFNGWLDEIVRWCTDTDPGSLDLLVNLVELQRVPHLDNRRRMFY